MKSVLFIKISVVAIGLCMIFGSIYLAIDTSRFLDEAVTSVGKVVDLVESDSKKYAPVVRFFDSNGSIHEFKSRISSSPPEYYIGEKLVVLYLSPREAKIKDFSSLWGTSVVLGVMGLIFFIIGSLIMLFDSFSRKKNEYLKEHGEKVTAKFKSVELNKSLEVNGRNPFQIVAERLDPKSNKLYIYKSENMWFDPTDYVTEEFLTVYVDKLKSENYFLDTSFLPEVVE